MPWENRKRGGKYYTRKLRVGNHVVSLYVGTGESAELIARMDQLDRAGSALSHIVAAIDASTDHSRIEHKPSTQRTHKSSATNRRRKP